MMRVTVGVTCRTALVASALVLALSASGAARAEVIVGYNPSAPSPNNPTGPGVYDPRFDRFSTNFPGEAPLSNTSNQFVAAGQDLSGIGWLTSNPVFGFAMISPRHFIAAAHNGENTFLNGTSVSFFTGTGTTSSTVTRTVASSARVASTAGSTYPVTDILFGTLSADVPANVTFYSVPVGIRSQFNGAPVYMYDQEQRFGTNNVSGFSDNENIQPSGANNSTNLIAYDFNPSGPPGEALFTTGDSGSPTFMLINGRFSLLGPHLAIGTDPNTNIQFSFDGFLPDYITQLNTLMLGSGFTVTAVPVPEPTTLALTAVAAGAAAGVGWLRRRRAARRPGAA